MKDSITAPDETRSFVLICCAFIAALASSPIAADEVTSWRVRGSNNVELNDRVGWVAAERKPAEIEVDREFRVRFEIERAAAGEPRYRLEMRRNGAAWMPMQALDHPYPEEIASPVSSVTKAHTYDHGEATEDLIGNARDGFAGGSGISLRPSPLLAQIDAGSSEWEWPLVIRYFSDGAVRVNHGDAFEYRMVQWDGTPLAGPAARVSVQVPEGHLGGTYIETPGRIGPFEAADGDLYFIQEPAETDNVFMVVKSEDHGRSWFEVDGAHRPQQADLEAVSAVLVDDTLHIVHQADAVWYHQFRTSDHRQTPDTWGTRDLEIHGPVDPPTQVASISARSDGSLVVVYGAERQLLYRFRSPDGQWGELFAINDNNGSVLSSPVTAAGEANEVHLAYVDVHGNGWLRTILGDGALTKAERFATDLGTSERERFSLLPLNRLASGELSIIYRKRDGTLHERRRAAHGTLGSPAEVTSVAVTSGPVDSDQVTADAIAFGDAVHVLYVDEATQSLWHVARGAEQSWQSATRVIDDIEGQWIRGALLEHGLEGPVYGYVIDTGSYGGSGRNRYGMVALSYE